MADNDVQTLTRLLNEIEKAGFFSVEGVINAGLIEDLYAAVWLNAPLENRPSKDYVAARIWLAARYLQRLGMENLNWSNRPRGVLSASESAKQKAEIAKQAKTLSIPIEQISGFWDEPLSVPIWLHEEEITFLVKALQKRGFGLSGLPVVDIYRQGRQHSKAVKQFDPEASDWTKDPVFDLVHYAVTSRHDSMNTEWEATDDIMVYSAWFIQLNQQGRDVDKLVLYRGKFVVEAETTPTNTLLRTSHIQRIFGPGRKPVRHDGLMFGTRDKLLVLGFSRDHKGNHTPQTMQLDGRNLVNEYAGVYDMLGGWTTTAEQFQEIRRDGLVGTGIFMRLDGPDREDYAAAEGLPDLLPLLSDPAENYCKRVVRSNDGSRDSVLKVSTTVDKTERTTAPNEVFTSEELNTIYELEYYSDWTVDDIGRLIPGFKKP